ncbi:hypothetical protein EFP69_05910 [Lactobacillus helveticus]|nr:hypothetical protein [Lactobacillus helveticus]
MALMGISEMILVDPDKVELSNLNRQGITSTYVDLHIRGEYSSQSTKLEWSAGSPPHTWRIPITHLLLAQ